MINFLSGLTWRGKWIISLLSGISLSIISWFYLNSNYTLEVEDSLFVKEVYLKNKLLHIKPSNDRPFVFINTGNDLKLIDNPEGLGSVVVADRYKLYQLIQLINKVKQHPKFILLNVQFAYAYQNSSDSIRKIPGASCKTSDFPDPNIDKLLQNEIEHSGKRLMMIATSENGELKKPIYSGPYGISHFETYGKSVNKVELDFPKLNSYSVSCLLNQKLDNGVYQNRKFFTTCNGRLCFNYIWPDYFYYLTDSLTTAKQNVYYPSITGALADFRTLKNIDWFFKGKVIIIGNFNVTMDTPAGKMPGTVAMIDTYLTLLNGKHLVSIYWLVFLFAVFSCLSFVAIFSEMPLLTFNFESAIAEKVNDFFKKYLSYLGALFVVSLLSVFLFNMSISLVFPAFIFSVIASIKKLINPQEL